MVFATITLKAPRIAQLVTFVCFIGQLRRSLACFIALLHAMAIAQELQTYAMASALACFKRGWAGYAAGMPHHSSLEGE